MRLFRNGLKRRLFRRAAAAAFAVAGAGALLSPVPVAAAASCADLEIPVTHLGLPQTMYGRLCTPAGDARTVHVLVPGGSYNSVYWDFTYTPETRSYRLAMNKAGYATLALDRLGTGRSSKPLLITAITQAEAVHGAIQAMRTGAVGPRFDKVVLTGHSLGSAVAILEAGTYRDADGVVITGLAHKLNALGVVPTLATLVPVALDPGLSQRGFDPTYLTTRQGARYTAFHTPGPLIQAVIDRDESTKDAFAPTEIVDGLLIAAVTPYSRLIDKPVLVVMGEHDTVFCGLLATDCSSAAALKRSESLYYSSTAQLSTHVLQDYGHSINYAPNAPDLHQAVVRWADGTVGH